MFMLDFTASCPTLWHRCETLKLSFSHHVLFVYSCNQTVAPSSWWQEVISSELYHVTVSEVTAFRKSRWVTAKPGEDAVASKWQLSLCLDMSSLLRRFCSVRTICPVLVKTHSGLRLFKGSHKHKHKASVEEQGTFSGSFKWKRKWGQFCKEGGNFWSFGTFL